VINLFWLLAHKGIPGNETADSLAKKASILGYKPPFKIPYSDLYSEVKESLGKQFSTYLEESARVIGSMHVSLLLVLPAPSILINLLIENNRKETVLINRIRSNHYNLNFSLFQKNMITSAACSCGDPKQDINHIIFFCPITTPKFSHLRTFLVKSFPYHPIDIFPILNNFCSKLIRLLLAYLKANDILI